jgi:hypothetical protein
MANIFQKQKSSKGVIMSFNRIGTSICQSFHNSIDPNSNILPAAKEFSKYYIPSLVLGLIFKGLSDNIRNMPVENVVNHSELILKAGYITMLGVMTLGLYKMAETMNTEKKEPVPETITISKAEHNNLLTSNEKLQNENLELNKKLEDAAKENDRLRLMLNASKVYV